MLNRLNALKHLETKITSRTNSHRARGGVARPIQGLVDVTFGTPWWAPVLSVSRTAGRSP